MHTWSMHASASIITSIPRMHGRPTQKPTLPLVVLQGIFDGIEHTADQHGDISPLVRIASRSRLRPMDLSALFVTATISPPLIIHSFCLWFGVPVFPSVIQCPHLFAFPQRLHFRLKLATPRLALFALPTWMPPLSSSIIHPSRPSLHSLPARSPESVYVCISGPRSCSKTQREPCRCWCCASQ
ncbi:hypothetical protein B0T10DRAFT_6694 [Thelonectria olida]|uniref:Uncharacterized protein n=1 Tax=Thelonectria olida TaxID=1576542 RepID=A0A9P8WL79_9HYPO|nr:hypothetical protein B0T10DRAFT_6694 [Thelonectria olida]